MIRRRDLLVGAAGVATAVTIGGAAVGRDPESKRPAFESLAKRPSSTLLPRKIAFGSCAKQNKPQPIWDAINALRPDLFIFLGDNVYGDTRDVDVLCGKYAALAAQPGFRRLCEQTAVLATWDDHDYGEDDAGAEYPMKRESQQVFCDFWGESRESPRRTRDGIYDAVLLSDGERRLQILLPDLRFNRTPIRKLDLGGKQYDVWSKDLERRGEPVPGPYERNPDGRATMLGEIQWRWLEQALRQPADVRILASSLQVVADFPGWEAWINYADDHQRLIEAIRREKANGLFCISGDTHYGEVSVLERNAPYALWDITSSGLTETWPVTPPNALRRGELLREANFGWIDIDWAVSPPRVVTQVRRIDGSIWREQVLNAADLTLT